MSGRERYSAVGCVRVGVLIPRQDDYLFHATRKLLAIEPRGRRTRRTAMPWRDDVSYRVNNDGSPANGVNYSLARDRRISGLFFQGSHLPSPPSYNTVLNTKTAYSPEMSDR